MIALAHDISTDAIAACDHCGLPLPMAVRWSWPWRKRNTPSADLEPANGPRYCCSGCRFAADVAREQNGGHCYSRWLVRLLASLFLTINVTMITMVLWSLDVYGVPASLNEATAVLLADVLRWASWLLSLPVLWMLGEPLYEEAKSQLRQGRIATDALLLAGVVAALAYSGFSLWQGTGAVYCEIACVVLVLVTLGRWLESMGKLRATAAIDSLAALLPTTVRRLNLRGRAGTLGSLNETSFEAVPLADIRPGDQLWIMAGERIPVDARIVAGNAAVDEQLINGESQPRLREVGNEVPGGGLSLDGSLMLECTAASNASSLNRIVQAVRAAQLEAGRYQQLVDRIAAWFTPAVLVIALVTLGVQASTRSWSEGGLSALSVILIACPCALGIATPLAVWTSLGRASQAQVLFRNGKALEQLASASVLLFDKTGTLTTGSPQLTRIDCAPGHSEADVLPMARALAKHSQHPLSRAIVQDQEHSQSDAQTMNVVEVQTLPGRGLSALLQRTEIDEVRILLGSERMMREEEIVCLPEFDSDSDGQHNGVRVFLAIDGQVCAAFIFQETLRPEVPRLIKALHQQGWQIELLSGDDPRRVAQLADELRVAGQGGLLPADKTTRLRSLQAAGKRVVMIGDGINDAPALAAADVGIALGCGADLSRQSADLCLLGNDLTRIPWAVELARFTLRVVRQNLAWAFGYNVVGIGLAVAGKLNPVWAAFFMVAGSLVVIGNSMRLAAVPLPDESAETVTEREPDTSRVVEQIQPEEFALR